MSDQLSSDLHSLRITRGGPKEPPPPRSWGWLYWAGGGVLVVALLAAFGIPAAQRTIFKTNVEVTEVIAASPARATVQLTASGYVVPQRTSKVGAKITGRLAKVHVREGDAVKKDQIIAELEDAQERSSVAVIQARVASAEARLRTAGAQLTEAEQQAERQKRLAAEGVSAQATVDDLVARRDSVLAARDAARAELDATRAEMASVLTTLSYMKIAAPMDGVIIGKPAEAGELVGVMAAHIAEVADMNSLMVEVDVPERRLAQVVVGNPCEIVLDAFPSRRLRCKVHEISRKVDRSKATVTVKASFVDDPEGVLPDMSARVGFLTKELSPEVMNQPDEILVPKSALVKPDGRDAVFVIREGKARIEPVELGEDRGDYYLLVRGPIPGTRIVNNPPSGMADGNPVREDKES